MSAKMKSITISLPIEDYNAISNLRWELRTELPALYRKAVKNFIDEHTSPGE